MVRDRRVPLELCPTSNVHSGAAASIAEHPIGLLADLRFRVTVNTDNRLMSAITLSREMANLVEAFGLGWDRLEWLTINAMKSAFLPFDERLALMDRRDQAGLRGAALAANANEPGSKSPARATTFRGARPVTRTRP